MNWTETLGAIKNWISGASTLPIVEVVEDNRRYMHDEYFAQVRVDQVEDINQLVYGTDFTADGAGGFDSIYTVDGAVRVTLSIAFVAYSQAPDDFAFHWSELFRARSRIDPIYKIIRDEGIAIFDIGTSVYFEEEADDRIYSRAVVTVILDVCTHYASDPSELGPEGPVQQVELTVAMRDTGGNLIPQPISRDQLRIPADPPPPLIDSAIEMNPIHYWRLDQGLTLNGLRIAAVADLVTGDPAWALTQDTDANRPILDSAVVVPSGTQPAARFLSSDPSWIDMDLAQSFGGSNFLTQFVFGRYAADEPNGVLFVAGSSTFEQRQNSAGGTLTTVTGAAFRIDDLTPAIGEIHGWIGTYDENTTDAAAYRGGALQGTLTGSTAALANLASSMGARRGGSLPSTCTVFEAGIFDRVLDAAEIAQLTDYFLRRYGVG